VAFEIIGNPKEYVEDAITRYVNNIRNDSQIKILNQEFGEAEEIEGGLFSTYADLEMLFDNLEKVNWLCVNFMPASVEIIAPEELRFSDKDLTLWFNDLLAKLHEISATVRQTTTKDQLAVQTMNALIQNIIILATEQYHKTKEISEKTGMPEEQLKPFLDALIKQGKLEKKGEEYHHSIRVQKGEKKSGAKKRD
jgi:hypothetical protein